MSDVCLILEGTFPYVVGGVSTWIYDLIRGLPDVKFSVIHLSPTPTTYRETFTTLEAQGVLAHDLSVGMQGWAGLRNVLAHMYLEVDYALLHDILKRDLDQLEAFAAAVARCVRQQ